MAVPTAFTFALFLGPLTVFLTGCVTVDKITGFHHPKTMLRGTFLTTNVVKTMDGTLFRLQRPKDTGKFPGSCLLKYVLFKC